MTEKENPFSFHIDASKFQQQLSNLAEVIAQKVLREGPTIIAAPQYVTSDLFLLLRHARHTCDLLYYINSEEHRKDYRWRREYTIASAPLVRSVIDCLYNITAILLEPNENGVCYRKSGLRSKLESIDRDAAKFGGQRIWDEWIEHERDRVTLSMRKAGLTLDEIRNQKYWPNLGTYLRNGRSSGNPSKHQQFMETFELATWRWYSALAHGSCDALIDVGAVYARDVMPHDERDNIDEAHLGHIAMHIVRAATVLLCIVTEVQAHFRFAGANVNDRMSEMWNVLNISPEAAQLYDARYQKLIADRHLTF